MQRGRFIGLGGAFLFGLVSCGGGGTSGSSPSAPTAPTFPSLMGSYIVQGTTTGTVRETGEGFSSSCRGTLSITTQSGGDFSGTITCDDEEGIVNGTVRVDGTIPVFATRSTSPPPCQVVSGQRDYSGAVAGRTITVQRTHVLQCSFGSANRSQAIVANR